MTGGLAWVVLWGAFMPGQDQAARVAIVDGVRTPFAKRHTEFRQLSAVELGVLCVAELLHRSAMELAWIDQVVFGQVIPSMLASNIAREVALDAGLDPRTEGYSVARACATSYQSIVSASFALQARTADCVVAGGADSASTVPVSISAKLVGILEEVRDADSWRERAEAVTELSPSDFKLCTPKLEERSTGLSMGESAEYMAKANGISRADQDAFAHRSHVRASAAWDAGKFDEVMPMFVPPDYESTLVRDNLVRGDSSLDNYAELEPVFDRSYGTLTAGNSSPLSDGASAVLMMREDTAAELGLTPLGFVRSHAFVAVDPQDQLLIGPAKATPIALERAGLGLADLDLIDMHEAFAAQVLSVVRRLEADGVGTIDMDRLNVNGGSIALGHPFAATGARQVMQTLNELRRRGGGLALCSACAAGGLAAAIVLEAA